MAPRVTAPCVTARLVPAVLMAVLCNAAPALAQDVPGLRGVPGEAAPGSVPGMRALTEQEAQREQMAGDLQTEYNPKFGKWSVSVFDGISYVPVVQQAREEFAALP